MTCVRSTGTPNTKGTRVMVNRENDQYRERVTHQTRKGVTMSGKNNNRDRSKHTNPAMIELLENRTLMSVVAQQVGGDIPMRLPFQNGMQVLMNNGYGNIGDSDHHGFAVDFNLNQGTPVLAPFAGRVVDIGTYSGTSSNGIGLTSRDQLGRFVKIEGQGTTATWDVWLAHLS